MNNSYCTSIYIICQVNYVFSDIFFKIFYKFGVERLNQILGAFAGIFLTETCLAGAAFRFSGADPGKACNCFLT